MKWTQAQCSIRWLWRVEHKKCDLEKCLLTGKSSCCLGLCLQVHFHWELGLRAVASSFQFCYQPWLENFTPWILHRLNGTTVIKTYWKTLFSGSKMVEIIAWYLEPSNAAKDTTLIANKTLVHGTNKTFSSSCFFLNVPQKYTTQHIFKNLMVFPRGIYCDEYLRRLEWHEVDFSSILPCVSGCGLLFLGYGMQMTCTPWIGPCSLWPLSLSDLWPPEPHFSESGHWNSFPFIHRTLLSIKDKVTL